jgi:hypothetical protein
MAQQSARRGWKNQANSECFKRANVMWIQSANSHTGLQHSCCTQRPDRWQHPTTCQSSSKKPLASAGRPQMDLATETGQIMQRLRSWIWNDQPEVTR